MKSLISTILFLFLALNSVSQTNLSAEEHYKKAEEYSEQSKKHYAYAAIAFGFVIAVKVVRRYMNKEEKEE